MTGRSRSLLKAATALALIASLSACGGGRGDGDGFFATFWDSNEPAPLDSFGPEEIYKRGEFQLETKDVDEAIRLFSEVERLYPYSEWAKRALIMQAFAYHSICQVLDPEIRSGL